MAATRVSKFQAGIDAHGLPPSPQRMAQDGPVCFWALLAHAEPTVVYVDPAAQEIVGAAMDQSPFIRYVHPDDRARVRADLVRTIESHTMFGNMIRCRFATLGTSRAEPAAYGAVDIVVNCVCDGVMLAFIHAVDTRECTGCRHSGHVFDAAQGRLAAERMARVCPTPEKLERVFQILATDQDAVYLNWPAPDGPLAYTPAELTRLSRRMRASQQHALDSSCTRRFRATHMVSTNGKMQAIATVLIPYGSVTFACYHLTSEYKSGAHASESAPAATSGTWQSDTHVAMPLTMVPQEQKSALAAVAATVPQKKCSSCGRDDSPEWRRGPSGHKTLCNACGLRYARSLSNKRRRGKDGEVVVIEPTGNPNTVPPSRGSGGGSRRGTHRRLAHQRTDSSAEQMRAVPDSVIAAAAGAAAADSRYSLGPRAQDIAGPVASAAEMLSVHPTAPLEPGAMPMPQNKMLYGGNILAQSLRDKAGGIGMYTGMPNGALPDMPATMAGPSNAALASTVGMSIASNTNAAKAPADALSLFVSALPGGTQPAATATVCNTQMPQ